MTHRVRYKYECKHPDFPKWLRLDDKVDWFLVVILLGSLCFLLLGFVYIAIIKGWLV